MCRNVFRFATLLFLLGTYTASEETLQKTLEIAGTDVTHICQNHTMSDLLLLTCYRNREHECRISLRYDENHTNTTCDSRVNLQNDSSGRLFLHITNIQPSDEGIYQCECAYNGGTDYLTLHLNITFNETDYLGLFLTQTLTGITAFIVVMIFTAIIMRKVHLRRTQTKVLYTSNEEEQQPDIEPYDTFIKRDNMVYSTLQQPDPNL